MEPRNVIVWTLLVVLAVLVMSAGVQAQELREVPASEILEQIQAGENVNYTNIHVTEELDISKIGLKTVPIKLGSEIELKIVESEIVITHSVFENNIDFSNTQFKKNLTFYATSFSSETDFRDVNFSGYASFRFVSFDGPAHFDDASFGGDTYFSGANFSGGAIFNGVTFSSYARFNYASFGGGGAYFRRVGFDDCAVFRGASFSGDTYFSGANFSRDAYFDDASFGSNVYFWDARFGRDAIFRDANFSGDAHFEGVPPSCIGARFGRDAIFSDANFSGDAHFNDSSFGGDANFRSAKFSGDAYFKSGHTWGIGVSFGGDADFGDVNFSGDADFREADFSGDADFESASFDGSAIFNSAEFNKVSFYGRTFTKVDFNETDFKSMKVEWASLEDALIFNGPTYIKLIKNFREMEQFEDADDAYYQYRRQSQANKEWSFPKLEDIFIWLSCGYGVRPWRAPAWGVLIIFIFGLIYRSGTLNFWPLTRFDCLRESGIRRLKERDEGAEQDMSGCEVLYSSMAFLAMIGLILLFCKLDVKPQYTAILAVAAIFMFGHIYRLGNDINTHDVSFYDALYFSVTTFTTVGYGDWYPKDRYRKFVMIEGLLGWLTLALFLVTLANVMIRP